MIRHHSLLPSDLPSDLPAARIAACIGLISDTHVPSGMKVLPPTLFEVFEGVDLILHAGDVGDLAVLDQLGEVAPVVAVGGNDDSLDADRLLPYTQLIWAQNQRILVWHSHRLDLNEEYQARADDRWQPKLDYLAAFGKARGASLVVYGHSHIPMMHQHDGVLLINPGMAGMGTAVDRALIRTAALLFLRDDGQPFVTHFEVPKPDQAYVPHIDWEAGFKAAAGQYCGSLLDPLLQQALPAVRPIVWRAQPQVRDAFMRMAQVRWEAPNGLITVNDVLTHVCSDTMLPADVRDDIRSVLEDTLRLAVE